MYFDGLFEKKNAIVGDSKNACILFYAHFVPKTQLCYKGIYTGFA